MEDRYCFALSFCWGPLMEISNGDLPTSRRPLPISSCQNPPLLTLSPLLALASFLSPLLSPLPFPNPLNQMVVLSTSIQTRSKGQVYLPATLRNIASSLTGAPNANPPIIQLKLVDLYGGSILDYPHLRFSTRQPMLCLPVYCDRDDVLLDLELWGLSNPLAMWALGEVSQFLMAMRQPPVDRPPDNGHYWDGGQTWSTSSQFAPSAPTSPIHPKRTKKLRPCSLRVGSQSVPMATKNPCYSLLHASAMGK